MQVAMSRRGTGVICFVLLRACQRHPGLLKTDLAMAGSLNGLQAVRYVGLLEARDLVTRIDARYYVTDLGRQALYHLAGYLRCVGMVVDPPPPPRVGYRGLVGDSQSRLPNL